MYQVVSTELAIARSIVSAGTIHGGRVGESLDPKLLSFLVDGRTLTGTADVQEAVVNWILHETEEVETVEKMVLDEVARLDQLREQRDAQGPELYRKALGVRTVVESTAGQGKSSQLVRLDPGLATVGHHVLRRTCRAAVDKLTEPGLELPRVAIRGASFNPQEAADDIRPLLESFEKVLDDIELQQRVVEEAQRLKSEALERLHFVIVNGSLLLESFFNLAGERYHAERLRRTRARSAVRPALPTPAPSEPPDSSGDGGPPEESASTEEGSEESASTEEPVSDSPAAAEATDSAGS